MYNIYIYRDMNYGRSFEKTNHLWCCSLNEDAFLDFQIGAEPWEWNALVMGTAQTLGTKIGTFHACMYAYTYTYIHTHTYIYIYIHREIDRHTDQHKCVHKCIYILVIHACIHTSFLIVYVPFQYIIVIVNYSQGQNQHTAYSLIHNQDESRI